MLIRHSFETRPGPAGRSGTRLTPGLELGRIEEKTGKKKTRCDPARPGCKPVDRVLKLCN